MMDNDQVFLSLDEASCYKDLLADSAQNVCLKKVLNPQRVDAYQCVFDGLSLNYAATQLTDKRLELFQKWADEQAVVAQYKKIISGEIMNVNEGRSVNHHALRELDKESFYLTEYNRFTALAEQVRKSKAIRHLVQIGIGGSFLGPKAIYDALMPSQTDNLVIPAEFISNADPQNAADVLARIDTKQTLFILVSKSGGTQETLSNWDLICQHCRNIGISEIELKAQTVIITGKNSPLDRNKSDYKDVFYIDDAIGGRFSVTSAVGGFLLSTAFGKVVFTALLSGAHQMDLNAKELDTRSNMSLLMALISVWERVFLGCDVRVVVPYVHSLFSFLFHLQQLDCESNGKSYNRRGMPLSYPTASAIMGDVGSNAQHSFFQLLHQGTMSFSIQFIGCKKPVKTALDGEKAHQLLNNNLSAQILALALGDSQESHVDNFPGNHPSTVLVLDEITPYSMGQLLAFYENYVMFQGFLFDVNSYDQPGVELGKTLSKNNTTDENIQRLFSAYTDII